MDSDAGGEDDDFGDEVRSDDEEEVGNDDANEGGGTLHQVNLFFFPEDIQILHRLPSSPPFRVLFSHMQDNERKDYPFKM